MMVIARLPWCMMPLMIIWVIHGWPTTLNCWSLRILLLDGPLLWCWCGAAGSLSDTDRGARGLPELWPWPDDARPWQWHCPDWQWQWQWPSLQWTCISCQPLFLEFIKPLTSLSSSFCEIILLRLPEIWARRPVAEVWAIACCQHCCWCQYCWRRAGCQFRVQWQSRYCPGTTKRKNS